MTLKRTLYAVKFFNAPSIMKKITFLLLFLCVASFASFGQKIGFLMDSYITDRWYMDQKFVVDKIKELGGECIVEIPYGDANEQLNLAKKLIANKIDVLIIVPSDTRKAVEIVNEAKKANVPVISYDRLIQSNDISYYISYDTEKVGRLQAEYALSKVPEGNYVLINGPVSDYNGILFRRGQLQVLEPHVKSGKVKIILDHVLSDWSEMEAMMKVSETFGDNAVQPQAIVAANDALANGAILALKKDLLGKVVITGQDADITGMKNIISNNQNMTIYKPIKPLATRAAEVAMELAKTHKIEGAIKVKVGDQEVYAELLSPVVVDKNNYKETVVKDGHVQQSELAGN
jgi:D-xylose transport system substrate-binding protein